MFFRSGLSFADFFAVPVTLRNALVAEVASRLDRKALDRLDLLGDLAAEQGSLHQPQRRVGDRASATGRDERAAANGKPARRPAP